MSPRRGSRLQHRSAESDRRATSNPMIDDEPTAEAGFVLEPTNAVETWRRAVEKVPGMIGD